MEVVTWYKGHVKSGVKSGTCTDFLKSVTCPLISGAFF